MFKAVTFILFVPLAGFCQTKNNQGKIWLTNSRGELLGGGDTAVSFRFFDAEWVRVLPDYDTDPQTEWWLVVRGGRCETGLSRFKTTELPADVIQKIKGVKDKDATFMLFFQPEDPDDWDPKRNMLDFRLLEY